MHNVKCNKINFVYFDIFFLFFIHFFFFYLQFLNITQRINLTFLSLLTQFYFRSKRKTFI